MEKRKNKQIKDIIESNLPTQTKVELINKINEKSHNIRINTLYSFTVGVRLFY